MDRRTLRKEAGGHRVRRTETGAEWISWVPEGQAKSDDHRRGRGNTSGERRPGRGMAELGLILGAGIHFSIKESKREKKGGGGRGMATATEWANLKNDYLEWNSPEGKFFNQRK